MPNERITENLVRNILKKKGYYNDEKIRVEEQKTEIISLNKLLKNAEASTSNNNKLYLNLALNYGSKKEILNSFKSIIKKKEKLNLSNIRKNLYTSNMPDPDILIRTGNTTRLSNFLLWQLAYSEIYFVKKLWPDFTTQDYSKIIKKFKITQRNYGKI